MQSMMVFSHLRWNFVYQRPQHLMTRLAEKYRIYFFEEPVLHEGPAFLEITEPSPNVHVCRPHTPVDAKGFHDEQLAVLQGLIEELIEKHALGRPIAWLYTPMALPLLQRLDAKAIVYDCMDELAAFRNAPKQLLQRESALLKCADVVFTGGPSLYRSKQSRHEAVHCFASSVEQEHFGKARDPSIEHPAIRSIPHPRLGFYGVLDERLDIELIGQLAASHPEWQVVLVGPVVKIDAQSLPRRDNIHYLGQQTYADLPGFLAGWDVCLLPFALNDATRFISPTKTLEYMAAEKPIVSTPVADVVGPYGDIVYSGEGEDFISACEQALAAPRGERQRRTALMRTTVLGTSWDRTAAQMHDLIEAIGRPVAKPLKLTRIPSPPSRHRVVIMGAGPTGLSAAYHVGEESLLLEQNDTVGGWCRSIQDNGFTFDHAGHIMFSNDAYVQRLYRMLLGDNVHWQDREAWIFSKGVHTRYPFQGALYGLPPDVLKECLVGAIEARFGPLKNSPAPVNAGVGKLSASSSSPSAGKAESITDCCADGVAESTLTLERVVKPESAIASAPRNFEEFIYKVWGRGVAKHFAIPYNRKLWAVPLKEMETSWLGGRVPLPDLEEMIEGALRPVGKPMGPNARFGYPLRGGFQALVDGFLPRLRGELKLNSRIVRVVPSRHEVMLEDGSAYLYEKLVSTIPLPVLVKMIDSEAPTAVRDAASRLRHVSVRCVNLGVGRPGLTEKHWIYYPGDSVFHRIFVQGNASPHANAPGGFGLTCEITYSPHKPLPCEGEALIDRCIADCIKVGIIRADDIILARNQLDMPFAYVVYDHSRARNVKIIRDWLAGQDIVLAGRYSEWEYYNSDHAFLAGKKAAETVLATFDGEEVAGGSLIVGQTDARRPDKEGSLSRVALRSGSLRWDASAPPNAAE
jgi:UDP-galactopyranose mutase